MPLYLKEGIQKFLRDGLYMDYDYIGYLPTTSDTTSDY